jgi:hypothetical protein
MKLDLSFVKVAPSSFRIGVSPLRDAVWFIGLAYASSWLWWIPGALLQANGPTTASDFLLALGSFAPLAVALYLNLWGGRHTFTWGQWLRTMEPRSILAVLLLPVLMLTPTILFRLYENTFDLSKFLGDVRGAPAMLAGFIVLAFGEEVGWRGFLLPRLEPFRLVMVNFIIAFAWFGWQLPLVLAAPSDAFGNDGAQHLAAFLLYSILITPFFNRLALRSDVNVLLPTLLRACLKTAFAVYLSQSPADSFTHPYGIVALTWLAVLNVLLMGQLWLGRPRGEPSELERIMPLEAEIK